MRVAAATLLVITIVGCGGSGGPSTPTASPSPVATPTPSPSPSPSPLPSPSPNPGSVLALSCQANPRSGSAPLTVSFAAFPTGATGSYEFAWSFGDGGTSNNPNPSHTYAAAGVFDAVVRVTSGAESATCARDITVTTPTGPGPAPTPTPGPGVTTVTITNAGVSPANVQITRGGTVRFVNQSGSPHQMNSDPHPTHGNCPPLNQVPFLVPGQSGQTGAFTALGTCGYHDHLNPTNGSLQGTIQVNP